MSDLTNIIDDSVYLARDYSSIIKWFTRKLKFLTTDWTDLSISEPDTLCLSLIAYVFDLTNYKVDSKFLETVFSFTKSVDFLSDLYKLIGEEIKDYESGIIKCIVTNRTSEVLEISKYEILRLKDHHKELFTCIKDYKIYPDSSEEIEIVRGTPIYFECNKDNMSNGLFELPNENINRNFISVLLDGITELNKCDDAIFCETEAFSIVQYKKNKTKIRLSPSAYRLVDKNVIVIYNINDTYPLAENSVLLKLDNLDGDYNILSITTNDINEYTLNQYKLFYYQCLRKINTLINNSYDSSKFLGGRIDYINYKYEYETNFKSGNVDYSNNIINIDINEVPNSPVIISYIYYNENDRIEQSIPVTLLDIVNEIHLTVPAGYILEPMSVYIYINKDVISDTAGDGELKLVNSISFINFNFSTIDDEPIYNILNYGEIDYINCILSMVFNYPLSYRCYIEYKYLLNGIEYDNREYFMVPNINFGHQLNVPEGSSIVPGSINFVYGNNIIKDYTTGELYNYQSEESVLLDKIMNHVTVKRKKSDIILNKLMVRPINIEATVYLYKSNISTSVILDNIIAALTKEYKKGSHPPGETVKRLSVLLTIENSDPNIKYAKLEMPLFDMALDEDQISDIGSINISFERSE